MHALVVADTSEYGVVRVICDRPHTAKGVLERDGFAVSVTRVHRGGGPGPPGGLADVLEALQTLERQRRVPVLFLRPERPSRSRHPARRGPGPGRRPGAASSWYTLRRCTARAVGPRASVRAAARRCGTRRVATANVTARNARGGRRGADVRCSRSRCRSVTDVDSTRHGPCSRTLLTRLRRRRVRVHAHLRGACARAAVLDADIVGGVAVGADRHAARRRTGPLRSVGRAATMDGRVLWARDPDSARAMASTTKIMTAVVALEHGSLSDVVTVDAQPPPSASPRWASWWERSSREDEL